MDKRLLVVGMVLFLLGAGIVMGEEAKNKEKSSLPVPVKAEVKMFNGTPTLFINGKPKPVLICREHNPEKKEKSEYLTKAYKNGVDIIWFSIKASTGYSYTAEQHFEYYDKIFKEVLDNLPPNTYIFLQILTDIKPKYQPKWCEEHPDELMIWPPDMSKGNRVSTASEIWKKEEVEGLKKLIIHIRKSFYADRIIGGVICGGNGEWLDYWDYSKPAQEAFKRWVKNKYKEDTNLLRDEWKDEKITFDTISIPKWAELFKADIGLFYDPQKSQRIIDYFYYYQEIQADVAATFARAIKEASNGEMIVGIWSGSFFFPGWNEPEGGIQRRRHGAYGKLARDPNVDFFLTPYSYRERQPGGVYIPQFLPDSIVLNGKMAINEEDSRTLLTPCESTIYSPLYWNTGDNFGQAWTIEETIAVLKRNFAGIFSKPGSGISWFSLGNKGLWFDHPEILKTFSVFSEIANNLIGKDKKNSEIAVIVSNKSLYYQSLNQFHRPLIFAQTAEGLCKMGAPFDVYEDIDLTEPNFPFDNYKLYIFLNTFHFSEKEREVIKGKIRNKSNTVIWVGCPGFVSDKGLSVENISEVTGMKIDYIDPKFAFGTDLTITDYSHPITKGLPTNTRYGTEHFSRENILVPIFWCKDREVEILGELVATPPTIATFRKPGLCVKKFPNWTSIWSGAPNLPSSLLRNIARYAGCHIYDEGDDQIFASEKVLAIHTRYAGERTIKLPKKCDVYDPFQKKYIAKGVKEFKVSIPAATTELWILE